MRAETAEQPRKLRSGFSTGACATAVSLAGARLLLTGQVGTEEHIVLPRGEPVRFALSACRRERDCAYAATIKDAGDDPDVTHGATVFARVHLADTPGVRFASEAGVGTVTKVGLALACGEPAINPVPRQMMCQHLAQLAQDCAYSGGFEVGIGVCDGERLAERTMNARLGILGGLSILGTTGIVRPYSCSAYIASIHQSIDVACANGLQHLAACTGSSSESVARKRYQLDAMALVEMGDAVGAVLKYLKRHPIERLSLVGGFGKLTKLAAGHINLHSSHSQIDFGYLSQLIGARNAELAAAIARANTSIEVLDLCRQAQLPVGDWVCAQALASVRLYLPTEIQVDVVAIVGSGESAQVVGQA